MLVCGVGMSAPPRWLSAGDRKLSTDGVFTTYPLPNPRNRPTTMAIAQDGTLGLPKEPGRIGGMNPDGTASSPFRLGNRQWVAQSGDNSIAFLSFR
jgi:hypothetical protein